MELRAITENDKYRMLQILTDERVNRTYMLPDFEDEKAAVPLFRRLCELSREENRFVRGVFVENRLVGFLNDVEIEGTSIELGYVIHPDCWGRGYATLALKSAIGQLFAKGYHRVCAGAFEENSASLRVMEKAGMHRISKTDTVEYRGKIYNCFYCQIDRE